MLDWSLMVLLWPRGLCVRGGANVMEASRICFGKAILVQPLHFLGEGDGAQKDYCLPRETSHFYSFMRIELRSPDS